MISITQILKYLITEAYYSLGIASVRFLAYLNCSIYFYWNYIHMTSKEKNIIAIFLAYVFNNFIVPKHYWFIPEIQMENINPKTMTYALYFFSCVTHFQNTTCFHSQPVLFIYLMCFFCCENHTTESWCQHGQHLPFIERWCNNSSMVLEII